MGSQGFRVPARGVLESPALVMRIAADLAAETGEFEVLIGGWLEDIRRRAMLQRTATSFGRHEKLPAVVSVRTTVQELVGHANALQVLEKRVAGCSDHPQPGRLMGTNLVQVSGFTPNRFPRQAMDAIARDLQALYGSDQG